VRLLIELVLAAALIALAWETPYRQTVSNVVPWVAKSATIKRPTVSDPAVALTTPTQPSNPVVTHRPITTPAPTVSGSWMWDKKGPLDRPSPHSTQKP
jgi:hypothetical protein